MNPYPSVIPTDDLIFSSLKSSIFKAYFEQLGPVARELREKVECWGIILVYKEMFLGFDTLYKIGEKKFSDEVTSFANLPPENVFIIDLLKWDQIVNAISQGGFTLVELLKDVRENNSNPQRTHGSFKKLEDFNQSHKMDLSYLRQELDALDIKN